jgi:hypothetical protein
MHYQRNFQPLSRKEYAAYERYLTREFNPTNLITFNFNQPGKWTLTTTAKKLDEFSGLIDAWLKNKNQRTEFIAIPEHISSNLHYHAMVRTPDPIRFSKLAPKLWKNEVVASGDIFEKPDPVTPKYVLEFGRYMLKEYWKGTPTDTYYISNGGK